MLSRCLLLLIVLPILGAACAGRPAAVPSEARPSAAAPRTTSSAAESNALPPLPPLPPPPIVTEPMDGAPGEALLAEARLVASSCEDDARARRERTEQLILEMRREVDAEFERWHEFQPVCWQSNGWGLWGDEIGDAFGYGQGYGSGGLGLSGVGVGGGGRGRAGGSSLGAAAPTPSKASSHSRTNTQVQGVDEADIVKTDGTYVYLAINGALRIMEAMKPRVLSVTPFAGRVRELFVEGDRVVLYVAQGGNGSEPCKYAYDCQFAGDGSSTKIVVLDVAKRDQPKVVRELELSGSLLTARRIGQAVHTVVSDGDGRPPPYDAWPPDLAMCGTLEAAVRAKFKQLKLDNERLLRAAQPSDLPTLSETGRKKPLCEGLLHTPIRDGGAYTTIVSFDLARDAQPVKTATVQSRPGAVYASESALYLAVVHRKGEGRRYSFYGSANEVSDIHQFRIGGDAAETAYVGSGVVPGHVLNQFAMDEWCGYLRVATSQGHVPDPDTQSVVSVLRSSKLGALLRVGAIEGIAPGEDIRSVRFDGDRGYVVTFKKTDPLFVLDLYQPARPTILGELKIPGFSTYMQRIDRNHLLSIGFDADDKGSFAYFDGVILQLFDVSEPTRPKLIHKEKIGSRGSSSEAATDHLAFNYFAEKGLLAVPMTVCEGGGDGRDGNELAFSGLLVYRVDVEGGFTRLGGIDHGTRGVHCSNWWSRATSLVKRSIFLDDLVYSIAGDRVKVQRMGRFGTDVADIGLL